MKRITVHVDRLVLQGFDVADCNEIAEGLREELLRQFSETHLLDRMKAQAAMPILRIGGVTIKHGTMPRDVGVQLARGLGKGGKQ